jgi:hypothetical protein
VQVCLTGCAIAPMLALATRVLQRDPGVATRRALVGSMQFGSQADWQLLLGHPPRRPD